MFMCEECNYVWDVWRSIGDPEVRQCPKCGSYEIEEIKASNVAQPNACAQLCEVRAIEIAFDELSKYIDFHKTKNSLCNDNFYKVNLYHTIKDGLKKLSEHFS
jgi:peptide subunit release factor 1 (eRF1)